MFILVSLDSVFAANSRRCLEESSRGSAGASRIRDSSLHEHEALPKLSGHVAKNEENTIIRLPPGGQAY